MKENIVFVVLLMIGFGLYGQKPRLTTQLSRSAGFYDKAITVSISASDQDATIYYTLDGSPPNRRSLRYKGNPIKVKQNAVIRAYAIKGKEKSSIVTKTYLLEDPGQFPSVAIAIKPKYLFDEEYGLFQMGYKADTLLPHRGANFWSRAEILAHTEIFWNDGQRVFSGNTGFRIFGGMSRLFPQKSMSIITRGRYGPTRIRYPLLPNKDHQKYKYIVLRNSGSDWGKARIRDIFINTLCQDIDIEKQGYQPSKVYINGQYWGIYNIREKINRHFLQVNTTYHKDSVSILEHKGIATRGTNTEYFKMLKFMEKNSLKNDKNFAAVSKMMDIQNFTDLQVIQIFVDNTDAGGNVKYWRANESEAKWRWILYDTDYGFGLHKPQAYKRNSLEFFLRTDGPEWPNPPWSTFILRNLLKNPSYQEYFLNRFNDHMNTRFEPDHMVETLYDLVAMYKEEMPRHIDRWSLSKSRYKRHLLRIENFAKNRPAYMRKFLEKRFETGERVWLSIVESQGGTVVLNDHVELKTKSFEGYYYQNVPITLNAKPAFGYRFSHWEGLSENNMNKSIKVRLSSDTTIVRAVFESSVHPMSQKILFNEVSCNNNDIGDWVELYNTTEETVSLGGWNFIETKEDFVLPSMLLGPKEYLVICQDSVAFREYFPDVPNVIGNFTFGLSKKRERLQLYSDDGALIDSIYYKLEPRDSVFTISLMHPDLSNEDRENWEIKTGLGTPGSDNPTYLESTLKQWTSNRYLLFGVLGVVLLYLLVTVIYKNRYHFR